MTVGQLDNQILVFGEIITMATDCTKSTLSVMIYVDAHGTESSEDEHQ